MISRESSSSPLPSSSPTPTLWSLGRLIDIRQEEEEDADSITKLNALLLQLVQDITLRLEQQNDALVAMKQSISLREKEDDNEHQLDRVYKTIRDFQHLHKDTQKTCNMLLPALEKVMDQSESSSINPTLLLRHIQQTLTETYTRHSLTMESLAEMVIQVRTILIDSSDWNEAILRFLRARVGLQLLAEHGSQLAKQELNIKKKQQDQNKMGVISKEISVWELIDQSVTEAKHLCEAHYLHSPAVYGLPSESSPASTIPSSLSPSPTSAGASTETREFESQEGCDDSPTFTYVRPWLQFALVEILKNSMAITAHRQLMKTGRDSPQHHYESSSTTDENGLHPIFVQVKDADDFVTIEILDQAGGIEDEDNSKDLFSFCQTQQIWDRMDDQQTYAMTRSPLQGLGVGLCMSRMYLQHFGGTLDLEDRQEEELEPPTPLMLSKGGTIGLVDQALIWVFRWLVTLIFSISLCHYFGWIERWIWWKLEDEASKVLNGAKVTVGSFRLNFDEILQGKLTVYASNVVLHTPHREEWGWESPLVARIGKARVECNAPITIFHLVFFKQQLPIELYTLILADAQVFIERYESVFNVYLMDPCCILPPAPFEHGREAMKAESPKVDDVSVSERTTASFSSSKGDDRHHEEAQKLVDEMLGSVETLGRAARQGTFSQTVRQQGLELADRIREGLGKESRSNAETKLQLAQGVSVLRTAGKVAVKSLQSTPQLILQERLASGSKPPPLCRVGRIVLKDVRIFTRNNWIQLQDEDTTAGYTPSNLNNKVGWNKPIFVEKLVVRAAEMCPPMSLHDEDKLPAVYQTIDKVIEIVWRRLLTEIAKSNTGKLFSTALFEVLDLMKTSAVGNSAAASNSIDTTPKG
ncbi:MAG: hypothetical protein SGBAC_006220 [Bacillariaceae sp.]